MPLLIDDRIRYDDQEAGSGYGLNSTTVKVKTNYRTITFSKPPTGELLHGCKLTLQKELLLIRLARGRFSTSAARITGLR